MQQSEKENRTSLHLWLLLAASLIGLITAFYATQQTLLIQNYNMSDPGLCEINTWISCNTAQASSYAMFFGIPVAWWGFLLYLWLGFSFIWTLSKGNGFHPILILTFLLSAFSLIVVLYKAIVLFFVLEKFCDS